MLQMPDHLYVAESDEWVHVGTYIDLVRCFDPRSLAQTAAREPRGD